MQGSLIKEEKENELGEEKYRHRTEMLEQRNQAHRHFVSYVFHEVRTPFQAVILGISELEMILNDHIEIEKKSQQQSLCAVSRHSSLSFKSKPTIGGNSISITDDIKAATSAVERILDNALALRTDDALMSAFMHQNFRNQPDIIDTVRGTTGSIDKLLDDVHSLQRIEAGEFRIEQKPFLMSRVLQVAEKRCAFMMTKAGVHFKIRIDPEALALEQNGTNMILGDNHRILQVLTNLLDNASNFTSKGGAVVVDLVLNSIVETKPWKLEINYDNVLESDQVAVLKLVVTDTGVGIPPEKRESIFLPYSQIRAGELQAGGGIGLGLCISNEVVRRHGGNVVVTKNRRSPSSLLCNEGKDDGGTGCVFTTSLPLSVVRGQTKIPDGTAYLNQISSSSPVDSTSYTAHILLVEDSLLNQKMMGKLLQRYALTYEIASNGQEAVDRVVTRKERYHA
jgi:signal transduction histidine kinase